MPLLIYRMISNSAVVLEERGRASRAAVVRDAGLPEERVREGKEASQILWN